MFRYVGIPLDSLPRTLSRGQIKKQFYSHPETQFKVIILFRKACFLQATRFCNELASRQSSINLHLRREVLFGREVGERKPSFSPVAIQTVITSWFGNVAKNCVERCGSQALSEPERNLLREQSSLRLTKLGQASESTLGGRQSIWT